MRKELFSVLELKRGKTNFYMIVKGVKIDFLFIYIVHNRIMTQTDTKYKAPVELEPTPTRPIFIIEYLGIGVTQLNKLEDLNK